ncbi:MAG: hypothetical protein O6914_02490 [Chloroflexi bacterium]|nr:hypothetical protein [Chloroflexota bacterium]
MGSRKLRNAIRRLVGPKRSREVPPPGLPLEALLNLRMEHLQKQLDEVKGRVNGLLLVILGAVIADLVLRLLG